MMKKTPVHYSRDESGFTLVELLVVILIIGVLAAIAIPAFMNQRQRANVATLESDLHNVAIAMETWLSHPKNSSGDLFLNSTADINSESLGWTIVFRGDPEARFAGEYNRFDTPSIAPPPADFPDVTLSDGVAIGLTASPHTTGDAFSSYCLVGSVNNSPYDIRRKNNPSVDSFSYAMFYDSRKGGVYTPEELPQGGSCGTYHARLNK